MNVAHQLKQIGVDIYQIRLIPALKKMTNSLVAPVGPLGIPEGEILHDAGEPAFSYLDRQVDVIVEHRKRVNAVSKPLSPFLDQETKLRPVYVIIEHIIPRISPQDDMIQGPWIVDSWFT